MRGARWGSLMRGFRFPSFRVAASVGFMGCSSLALTASNFPEVRVEPAQATVDAARRSAPERVKLYPPIEPNKTGMLSVSPLHDIYYEESGNPNGKPVVYVHGGPGGGTSPKNRSFFDPAVYRIIMFDQRGCGKSNPHACLEDNTTWALVEDIEKIRKHLKVDKWQVFGGSWGSTLGLTYAMCHPDRVTELVLRGIFMVRRHELEWYYQDGASYLFPDKWEPYRDYIPPNERKDMMAAYHKRLTGDDEDERLRAAKLWTMWEKSTSTLFQDPAGEAQAEDPKFALAFARIENHYFTNRGFFDSDAWLLENAYKIRHIPTTIVQGRYDVVCPIKSAWDLHRALPEADLVIVPDSGHSMGEPGIASELIKATNKYRPSKK